jgi:hypothetical protein
MVHALIDINDERIQSALAELQSLILARFPAATFTVFEGEDPCGIYLEATVDVEDTDEVIDTYISRMVDMQVDEGLPVYAIVVQPIDRILALQERQRMQQRREGEPSPSHTA